MSKGFILESFVLHPCIPSNSKLTQDLENIKSEQKRNLKIEMELRVYARLLTKAWRKRCQEVRELDDTFRILKGACKRAQENLEWKNSRYLEQQYMNEELTCQLCINERDLEQDEKSNEGLSIILKDLESKKMKLLMKITEMSEKCITSNVQINEIQTKVTQFENKTKALEEELDCEIQKATELEEKSLQTAEKVCEYKTAVGQREELLLKEIEKLDSEIQSIKIERKLLKTEVSDLSKITAEMKKIEPNHSNVSTNFEKRLLSQQVASLRKSLERTFEHKLFKNILLVFAIFLRALKYISPINPRRIVVGSNEDVEFGNEITYALTDC